MTKPLPPPHPLAQRRAQAKFARLLLAWYDRERRDLPWRRTKDSYGIWLSEIMLQQTTVRTVEPRWERFLVRWPTMNDLAAAPLEDVLHEWTGLGYYARARNLHKAARVVAEQFGGELPREYEMLLALPGMGVYTAAAVASIAFGEPVPVVDANVERVLARLYALDTEIRSGSAKRRLRELAASLLEARRPGDFNQAMMELGARICLPRRPQCATCPVAEFCEARRLGEPESFPRLPEKPPMEDVREAAALIRRRGRILVLLVPEGKSFAGMWEIPRVKCLEGEESATAAARAARELAGLEVNVRVPVFRAKHTVMRSRISLLVFESVLSAGQPRLSSHEEFRWVTPEEWLEMPKSTTQRRLAEFLAAGNSDS
jgi:A/G-specific adenine glycosylase